MGNHRGGMWGLGKARTVFAMTSPHCRVGDMPWCSIDMVSVFKQISTRKVWLNRGCSASSRHDSRNSLQSWDWERKVEKGQSLVMRESANSPSNWASTVSGFEKYYTRTCFRRSAPLFPKKARSFPDEFSFPTWSSPSSSPSSSSFSSVSASACSRLSLSSFL